MSNLSQSPEGKPSLEASTSLPIPDFNLEDDVPQAKHFPIITIVLSIDDPGEPNHVDLGSVPPQIAAAALESISSQLKRLAWPSRVTYAGQMVFDPLAMTPDFDDEDDIDPCLE